MTLSRMAGFALPVLIVENLPFRLSMLLSIRSIWNMLKKCCQHATHKNCNIFQIQRMYCSPCLPQHQCHPLSVHAQSLMAFDARFPLHESMLAAETHLLPAWTEEAQSTDIVSRKWTFLWYLCLSRYLLGLDSFVDEYPCMWQNLFKGLLGNGQ